MSERTLKDSIRNQSEFHVWFESFAEFEREWPLLTKRTDHNAAMASALLSDSREGWTGVADFNTMLERVRAGWPEYLALVNGASKLIEATLDTSTVEAMVVDVRRRKRVRRDQGDTLDINRVWNGQLETAWERPERVPRRATSQRYATIYVDLTAQAVRKWQDGVWRAAAAMRMCDLLQMAGFAVEIWTGDSAYSAYPQDRVYYAWTGVCVKTYSQPLNEASLAALVSVSALRTLGFMLMLCSPYRASDSYGCALNRGLVLPLRERQSAGERVIRIGECWSLSDAQREIAAVAESLKPVEKAHETV